MEQGVKSDPFFYRQGEELEYTNLVGKLPVSDRDVYAKRVDDDINTIVIHHTQSVDDIILIANYHVYTRGYPGIAYHWIIRPDGEICRTNPHNLITYGVAGQNSYTVHIALIGDFNKLYPTNEQIESTKRLIMYIKEDLDIEHVVGHKDIAIAGWETDCPGNTWNKWRSRLE
jgi:N-acetylmuramoyl-L-alanine amidase